jgi:hypothetical protein
VTARTDRPRQHASDTLVVLLAGLAPALALSSGAYFASSWLPVLVFVALLALLVAIVGPRPALDRSGLALLGVLLFQVLWTTASISWARSPGNAWEETNRTALFALGIVLTALAVSWGGRRAGFVLVLGLLAGVAVAGGAAITELATDGAASTAFAGGRFAYPISYWNGAAALLMVGFWVAMALASTRALPPWAPPALVAGAIILAELALLPQSRGALWTFVLVCPLFVILSPHRFRGLYHLILVVAVVGLSAGRLTAPFGAAIDPSAMAPAVTLVLRTIAFSAVTVALGAAAGQLIEWWLAPLGRTVTVVLGAVACAAVLVLLVGLLYTAERQIDGGLDAGLNRAWQGFVSDAGTQQAAERGHRFGDVGLNGRMQQWKIAWRAFRENPVLGLGAQGFDTYYYEHRVSDLQVRQPHSQPLQLLSELGLPGAAAWLALVSLALARGLRLRFGRQAEGRRALVTAMLLGFASWFIHSSADWLWQLAGVTWPAVLLLGALIGLPQGDNRAVQPGGPQLAPEQARNRRAAQKRRSRGVPGRIALAAAALLVLASAVPPYLALRYADLAHATAPRDPEHALRSADRAARLNPLSSEPLVTRAQVLELLARSSDAESEYGRSARLAALGSRLDVLEGAREREPNSWSLAYLAGVAALDRGDVQTGAEEDVEAGSLVARRAGRHLRDATRMNPREAAIYEALGRLERNSAPGMENETS